ncbi:ArsR family transcriptional regulator [Antrihabitans sp. YC2-6]|uniref:ArsR family transcriptional regulator n=1 Tax=Antrihabitans sp. YC2-6 TaxID=2799498 RepID=UPI0018F5FA80|nr:ArsR family transcriptional regulator [Antrihabitans sp. YC2-6]MBJ8348582.1 ArsR family transcriptional regulator [Antrihabitans sp. YC2-6]
MNTETTTKKANATPVSRDAQKANLEVLTRVSTEFLGEHYDTQALHATVAAAAAHRLSGSPAWLVLISGSGNAKTVTVDSLHTVENVTAVSVIGSEGALLSASPAKDQTKASTGGLLREIGDDGIIVIKDFTSTISKSGDAKNETLAALREVYDGNWTRKMGVDGGKSLTWSGRVTVVAACTTAWDRAQSVIAAMGDRFVLCRMDSTSKAVRMSAGRSALLGSGNESTMATELSDNVKIVLEGIDVDDQPKPTKQEINAILCAAELITKARTAVERDGREPSMANAPEMPTRLAKQLLSLFLGGVAIGMERADAMTMVLRCGSDCIPPMRLQILKWLETNPNQTTVDVKNGINQPRQSTDRELQSLQLLGILARTEESSWRYRLADGIDLSVLRPCPQFAPPSL